MQKAKKPLANSQLENLLNLVYKSSSAASLEDTETAIQHDEAMREEFYDLVYVKKQLDKSLLEPSDSVTKKILDYSKLPKPVLA
ncbi:MAG: hypothetical protein EAZ57_00790 [Cytophagales bacterium]|nr:MAG: hypothetical protein EAZ67_00340 [Cytophagales bacterium]TAF62323.1 MAG: hypothetical protein EAZ57_00790 [Cytophagales bacterium]